MITIIQTIAFAISILIPLSIGKVAPSFLQIFMVLLISFASVYIGHLSLNKLKISNSLSARFAFKVIVGFSVLSLIELVLIHLLQLKPLQSFLILLAGIFVLGLFVSRSGYIKNNALLKMELKREVFDIAVLILISILVTIWCRDLILSLENAHLTGSFNVWPDLFLHTNEIISLENFSHLNNQSLSLAGIKKSFYHVASYALPSLYASATGELALIAATSFWIPTGIILMGLGIYLLGSTLGGRFVGLISVVSVFLLPDASMYGLKIGYFGFHWLLQISPGSGYAMSLIFLSISLFVIGLRDARFELIVWSVIVVMLSVFFRVQIAAPALIMIGILANIAWSPREKYYKLALYLFLLIAFTLIAILLEGIDFAPHFLSGEKFGSKFFDAIYSKITISKYAETNFGHAYIFFSSHAPFLLNWLIGYFAFLISSMGLVFPILFLWSIKKLIARNDRLINLIPSLLLLAGFLIIILIPTPPDGDYTNFGHRPFILYYATSITFIVFWMSDIYKKVKLKNKAIAYLGNLLIFMLTCLCIYVPLQYGKNIQQPKGWSDGLTINLTPSGLFDATAFIRENSEPGDLFLSSDLAPWAATVSLTERPTFISREIFYSNFNGSLKQDFLNKKKEFDAFKLVKSPEEFCRLAEKNQITWILKFPNNFIEWPSSVRDMYVFKSDNFYVYNLTGAICNKFLLKK